MNSIMNKFTILAAVAAVSVGFASCDVYDLPNPPAQSNPNDNIVFDAASVKVSPVTEGTVDLGKNMQEGKAVALFNVEMGAMPVDYSPVFVVELSANDTFEKTESFKLKDEEGTVSMSAYDIQNAVVSLISKSPEVQNVYARAAMYAVSGTSSVRIGGPDVYYYNTVLSVLPVKPENVIEQGYYLVGSFCNWDVTKGIPFTQVTPGNPYDHPEFSVKVDVTAEQAEGSGFQWMVVPQSAFNAGNWTGAFGVNGKNLVAASKADENPGVISQEGPYTIKVNMEKLTFEVSAAYEYLYIASFGTSTSNFDKIMRMTTNDYITYSGTSPLDKKFWFYGQPSTKGIAFRPNGADNAPAENGMLSGKMMYDPKSTASMSVPTKGLYFLTANVATLEWTAMPLTSISVIGGFNGWSLDNAKNFDLVPDAKCAVWTIKDVTFAEAGEFKFCCNHGWNYSFGGKLEDIVQNGGNLSVEPGTYDISLNFSAWPATCVMTKK